MINQNNSYSTLKNKHLSHNMFHITFNKIKISRDEIYFKKFRLFPQISNCIFGILYFSFVR